MRKIIEFKGPIKDELMNASCMSVLASDISSIIINYLPKETIITINSRNDGSIDLTYSKAAHATTKYKEFKALWKDAITRSSTPIPNPIEEGN